jgi:adenosylcobinamide-phosphate synthase
MRRCAVVEPVALLALALDASIGWPDALYRRIGHPVGLFAAVIGACERWWNRMTFPPTRRRVAGVVTVALLILLAGGGGLLLHHLAGLALGRWAWVGEAVLAAPGLAQRSLVAHVRPVAAALASGDLPAARMAVGRIVGRDPETLDSPGVARAGIESLAESFCDGVVAPLFWLVVLGLPGIWTYKAINTADSLIGHREPRWREFGWAAARSDDGLNWLPARLSAVLICLAGGGRGWRVMRRDARNHLSPNAGWPEAAMAGVLGRRLAGPVRYDGVWHAKPWIGAGLADVLPGDLTTALQVYYRACLLLWILAGSAAWLR